MHKTRITIGILMLFLLNFVYIQLFWDVKTDIILLNFVFLNLTFIISTIVLSIRKQDHVLEKNLFIPSFVYSFVSCYLCFSLRTIYINHCIILHLALLVLYISILIVVFKVNNKIAYDLNREKYLSNLRRQLLEKLKTIIDIDARFEELYKKYETVSLTIVDNRKGNISKSIKIIDDLIADISEEKIESLISLLKI